MIAKLFTKFYFIYLGFYVTFNTVQAISQRVVGRAEETSTCSTSGFSSGGGPIHARVPIHAHPQFSRRFVRFHGKDVYHIIDNDQIDYIHM